MSKGIDYGNGLTNIDTKTNIRYGVISQHNVLQAWCDSSEPVFYVCCPYCGEFLKKGLEAKRCPSCYKTFVDGDFDEIEPISYVYNDDGYKIEQNTSDFDLCITQSPYYTTCQFCSPCAPGAGYLMYYCEDGIKAYCFGHDWFENGTAPYPVYDVKTGNIVNP